MDSILCYSLIGLLCFYLICLWLSQTLLSHSELLCYSDLDHFFKEATLSRDYRVQVSIVLTKVLLVKLAVFVHYLCQLRVVFYIRCDQLVRAFVFLARGSVYYSRIDRRNSFTFGDRIRRWVAYDSLCIATWIHCPFNPIKQLDSHILRLTVNGSGFLLYVSMLIKILRRYSPWTLRLHNILGARSNWRSIWLVTAALKFKKCFCTSVLAFLFLKRVWQH